MSKAVKLSFAFGVLQALKILKQKRQQDTFVTFKIINKEKATKYDNLTHNKRKIWRFKPAQIIHDKDYQFALFFQESAKKIEIVKQVQSIVINSER